MSSNQTIDELICEITNSDVVHPESMSGSSSSMADVQQTCKLRPTRKHDVPQVKRSVGMFGDQGNGLQLAAAVVCGH